MDYKLIVIIVVLLVAVVGYVRLYRHYRRNIKKVRFLLMPLTMATSPSTSPQKRGIRRTRFCTNLLTASSFSCSIQGRSRWSGRNITSRY